jgi:nucleotide-binding universal stress UspA family protein
MRIAKWYDATLHVMHVMPPLTPSLESPIADASRRLAWRSLSEAVTRCNERGVILTTEVVESADPTDRIIEQAEAIDADLVVTGSHGRTGVKRLLKGSVVEPLLHRCRRPVLVIPAGLNRTRLQGEVSFKRILCAVDFSAQSLAALAFALSLAEEADAHLTLLNVIDVPPEFAVPLEPPDFDIDRARAEAEADRLLRLRALIPEHARDYCTVETAVLEGGVSRQILRMAEHQEDDLVVIGVHGRNALDLAVFGSNAKDLVVHAHCPVLIVPAGRATGVLRAAS